MKAVLLLGLMVAGAFAGCADDGAGPMPPLRAFSAMYVRPSGDQFTLTFGKVASAVGEDGQVREGYLLALPDNAGAWAQVLDQDLRVRRSQNCWVMDESKTSCGHIQVRFDGDGPGYGLALPWLAPERARQEDGRTVVTSHKDGYDHYEYEYAPGALWPERYVRRAPVFDEEEEQFHLVAVEVGDLVSPIAPWPPEADAGPVGPASQAFPDGSSLFWPFPFTIDEGLEVLAAHEEAGPILAGGCMVSAWFWEVGGPREDAFAPQDLVVGRDLGAIGYMLLSGSGPASGWFVGKSRDALGQETFSVVRSDDSWSKPDFACADRQAHSATPTAFLDRVPDPLKQGEWTQFSADWMRGDNGSVHLYYSAEWRPEDRHHFRSADMDATTGRMIRMTYKPSDLDDPYGAGTG